MSRGTTQARLKELTDLLSGRDARIRLEAVRELRSMIDGGALPAPECRGYTNNHVHTTYSFSPYTPAMAVWQAYKSGLSTVGIVDHDAIKGAGEFIRAGEILQIATTVGFEIRADWSETPLRGRRLNNPDQLSSAYICAHGLPHTQFEKADAFLSDIRKAREQRSRAMTQRLNDIMKPHGIAVDYDADVLPLSYAEYGGEVTERHILFALAGLMIRRCGKGQPLIRFLSGTLGIRLSDKQTVYLADTECGIYEYDLLNILKGNFVSQIYIDAGTQETPPVADAVAKIKELGAIPTYCYLGDVEASPTGDKRAQRFEDAYLDELLTVCRDIGFDAIAYMPSRNTPAQLERVMALCDAYGFLQISGEDINQPRQSFICRQLAEPEYAHLADTAWALVGHEKAAEKDIRNGMFGKEDKPDSRRIRRLIQSYKRIGLGG